MLSSAWWRVVAGVVAFGCTVGATWWLASCERDYGGEDQIARFRRTHPVEARQYTDLRPASLRAAMMLVLENNTDAASVARSVKMKWGDVPELGKYADLVLRVETDKLQHLQAMVRDFERDSATGGMIVDYVWADEGKEETGLLVLKGGDVVRRQAFVTTTRRAG